MQQGFRDLKVYQAAYQSAMDVFAVSRTFPPHERYSLTDQIRRASRSVAANIAEGYRKRQYPNLFALKLAEADAEATETQVWLDFARDCQYLAVPEHSRITAKYVEIGKMLGAMLSRPEQFAPADKRSTASG
jgi:four helix bundle protein